VRFIDLLSLILENLGRRKARVALTAIGVVIGTAAVVVLVSLGIGLQRRFNEGIAGVADLRQIDVYPRFDFPGPGVPGGGGGDGAPPTPVPITNQTIRDIEVFEGVDQVIPRDGIFSEAYLQSGRLQGYGNIIGIGTEDLEIIGLEAISGTTELARGTVIIGAEFANSGFFDPRTGMPGPPQDLYGKNIRLVVAKYTTDGVRIPRTFSVRVAGILARTGMESDYSIYIPIEEVTAINSWVNNRRINRDKDGYQQLLVRALDPSEVVRIADQINNLGYQASSAQQFLEPIDNFYLVLQVIFGGVGAIALLVAAIGIANTMTMAILERTREIGLMKAVGATNRDVLSIFLGEAAGIGFIGGLGGVGLGWTAGQLMNIVAVAFLAGGGGGGGFMGPSSSAAVVTPEWLMIGSLIFATFIGLISGLYPALRAATLVPVLALKYE